jgi:AraC-like DNA-binding protein
LAAEGTSFSAILNDARRDLAMQYLKENETSKAEIAYLLGYSEVSVFSRSFKKWTGLTPSEYASQNRS